MIVAGFGFRAGADAASFADALARAAGARRVDRFATLADKAAALRPFAASRDLPVVAVAPGAARSARVPSRSRASLAATGVASVAEAAALAAAGPGARLLGPRAISADRRATCALAIAGDGA